MEDRIKLSYFYGREADQYSFYRVPKLLFTEEYFKKISVEAKVLYGLMLDRMSLSMKNQWFDTEGRAYIYYSLEDIMDAMPYLLIALRYNSLVYCVPLIQHQDILPKLMLYHKSKGRQHFRLSLLDCLTAKPGGAVNGGSARAVHLAVDWLDWVCYSLSVVCKSFVKISSPAHNHFLPK